MLGSALLWLLACAGDKDEPAAEAEGPIPLVVIPTLDVSSPARGSFARDASVQLKGKAKAGSAPLAGLELNGAAVSMTGDGAFDAPLGLAPGVNILGLRVEDEDGERAVDGRAVYAGPLHDPGATLEEAIRIQLGPEMLDDDDPDKDDVAAIAEGILADGDLASGLLGYPIDADYFTITPTALSYSSASVDLVPGDGTLYAAVTLHDLWLDFDAEVSFVTTTGSAWADSVTLEMDLDISGSNGNVTVIPQGTAAALAGYGVTVDWFPDSFEDDLAGWTQGYLEEQTAAMAESMVSDLVGEYLQAFAIDAELMDGLDLSIALAGASVAPAGLRLTMDAVAEARGGGLPDQAGSAQTSGQAPGWPEAGAPFSVLADDDLVNQLLFAAWAGGSLSGFEFSGPELIALSGAEPVPPLGPVSSISLGMNLPPMLAGATEDDMDADLALGEWEWRFQREDGVTLAFSVNVRAGAQVSFDESAEIAVTLDNRPASVVVEVGVLESPPELDPGDLAALIRLMVPPLLGNADGFLPALSLPPLDLGLISGSLSGTELTLQDPTLSVENNGWISLSGRFAP